MHPPVHPQQARTLSNYATGLANIVSATMQMNHAGQSNDVQQIAKQQGLDYLAKHLEAFPLTDAHLLLQHGMNGIRYAANPEIHSVQKLFDNRTVFRQKCTESGALALSAFALKVFGAQLVENGKIDSDRLNMAMRMLFGNDMDELGGAIKYAINAYCPPNSNQFVLSSSHYRIAVSAQADQQKRTEQINDLITSENLDCGYFHHLTIDGVAVLFQVGDPLPDLLDECIGLDFRKPVKITRKNVVAELSRLSGDMNKGDLAHSRSSTTNLGDMTQVSSTVTSRYFADSSPSVLRKVQKYLNLGQNYS